MNNIDKVVCFYPNGRGCTIRMLYNLAGEQFDDKRVKGEAEWSKLKPETPHGALPILVTSNGVLNESNTIARYVAKKLGLVGQSLWEEALHDVVVENVKEVTEMAAAILFWKSCNQPEPAVKEQGVINGFKQVMTFVESISQKQGRKWIVGDKIGLAEVWLYTSLDFSASVIPELKTVTPWTEQFMQRFSSDERIAKIKDDRPPQ